MTKETVANQAQKTNEVTLTYWEIFTAGMGGLIRAMNNIRDKRRNAHGARGYGWEYHIRGAICEAVVAKYCDQFWMGAIGNLCADDAGPLQVRSAKSPRERLILHDSDEDQKRFVLVEFLEPDGAHPTFKLIGWCFAHEGKKPNYWQDPNTGRPAYFVPREALRPMSELTLEDPGTD